MDIGVEISLYPLHQHYIAPIREFIDRLNADSRLRVVTSSMSTQVFGEYELVMHTLTRELRSTLQSEHRVVFLLKIIGPLQS